MRFHLATNICNINDTAKLYTKEIQINKFAGKINHLRDMDNVKVFAKN